MGSYNVKEALRVNIESLRVVLENEGKKLTAQQLQTVKKFGGWNMKCILWDENKTKEQWEQEGASKQDIGLYDQLQEMYALLREWLTGRQYREAVASIRNSCLTSYYTPSVIPCTFYDTLSKYKDIESMADPSAGSGRFIIDAIGRLSLQNGVNACEKDYLTSRVLKTIVESLPITVSVYPGPFEEAPITDNGSYDLITSNIPFGQMSVYDPLLPRECTERIHNYFFAKGLEKLSDGGILAYLVSNAFLDTKGNQAAREYLFNRSDFISLTVMPDNLMKESANTEAPSHFLVCRKRIGKTEMSADEKLLCESKYMKLETGAMCSMNCYIAEHPEIIIGTVKAGKNQYGKGAREVWWDGPIEGIAKPFSEILSRDFAMRYHTQEECQDIAESKAQEYPESLGPIEIPIGKVEIIDANHWKWKEETVEELLPDTWEEEDNGLTDVENEARLKDMAEMEMGEGKYIDDTPPWEEEERTFSQAGLTTPYIIESTHEVDVVMTLADGTKQVTTIPIEPETTLDQLQINIPYKQGMIVKRTMPDTLFANKEELVVVKSMSPLVVEALELKSKEKEIMEKYLEIRDTFIALEKEEQNG